MDQPASPWAASEEIGRVDKGPRTSIRVLYQTDHAGRSVAQIKTFKGEEPTGRAVTIPAEEASAVGALLARLGVRHAEVVGERETLAELARS